MDEMVYLNQAMPRILKILLVLAAVAAVFGASAYLALTLIIRAEKTVVVPDLRGVKVVKGLKILSDLGLNTRVQGFEHSSDVPADRVIFQDPDPGTEIKAGRDVRMVISMGSRKRPSPDLTGLSIEQAKILLEEEDLCLKKTSRTYHIIRPRGKVVAQYPPAGRVIERGACLDLLVSRGPRPSALAMPGLTALPLDEAILSLEQRGLSLGGITTGTSEKAPANTVIEQAPAAGQPVLAGTAVHLTVQRSGAGSPRAPGKPGARLFRHRVPAGFLKRHLRIHLSAQSISMDLFNGFLGPGKEVWFLIPGQRAATVLVYEDSELIRAEIFDDRGDSLHNRRVVP